MRLAGFTLEHYGPFQHCALTFDPTPGRLNLVFAPNARGKSVLRRAIGDFLFDIPPDTPMAFLHGTQKMRLQAVLATRDGPLGLTRRKGRGGTLADTEGNPITTEAWRQQIGWADRGLFAELFGLDTALLRQGGDALLRAEGRLGRALFAGGGGLTRVNSVLDDLVARRDAIGRADRRHRARPLWAALEQWEQAGRDLGHAALRPQDWQNVEQQVAAAQAARVVLAKEQAEAATELQLCIIRPWLAARREAIARLAALSDAPRLDATFEKSWRDALAADTKATSVAAITEQAAAAQQPSDPAVGRDSEFLNAAIEIDTAAQQRGVALAEADLPDLERQLAAGRRDIDRLRHELGWDATTELPPSPAVTSARRHLAEHASLETRAAQAVTEQQMAEHRLALARTEETTPPPPDDHATLFALIAALRDKGEPTARLDAARARLREAEAALREAIAAVPDQALTIASLARTTAPSTAALTAAEAELTAALAADRAAEAELARVSEALDGEHARLAHLVREAELPDPGALARTRARRDRLWILVHQTAFSQAPEADAIRAEAGDLPLAIAYDRALREADAVADAMIQHSAQMAESSALRARIAEQEAVRHAAATARTRTSATLVETQAGLAALAIAAGAARVTSPAALRDFLTARQVALTCQSAVLRAAAELGETETTLVAQGASLAAAIGAPSPSPADLSALLAKADQTVTAARDRRTRQADRTKRLEGLAHDTSRRQQDATMARAALDRWTTAWAALRAPLNRPADEAPAATETALGLIEALRAATANTSMLHQRIGKIRDTTARFAADTGALVARHAPELSDLAATDAAARLAQRLLAARREAAQQATRQEALRAAVAAAATARIDADEAARTLASLRAALRAATNDEAETQLRRAREAAKATEDLARAEAELRRLGPDHTPDELEAAAASPPGGEEAAITELSARVDALSKQAEAQAVALHRATQARDDAAMSDAAGDAALRREAARARLAAAADQALLLHAARCLLKAGLERQRDATEMALLGRIGGVFAGLTCGDQTNVAIEQDGKEQALVALDAGGGRKKLEDLSEGTRDQLYLALRIVALEDYATSEPALPFIADDVLQTFDDARTLASLSALVSLSGHVQVIALTHHRHVADLAATLPAGSVHLVELPA
jgi:uncharacterized protein YhaN